MPPKKIGKYDVQGLIGQGSFGKVYLGVADNEQVALKFISKRSRSHKDICNLKMEVDLLTKIKHINVIALKQCIQTDTQVIVVMEYAGTDLSQLLKKQTRISQDKIRLYARQILSAMLYLHQNRILHRDLKPQNILLQKDTIKICDFGFAKKMSAATNFLNSIKGTPLYIAPEILLTRPYTHKVDVWSLGIILFELATGRTPFIASTIQQLQPKILHQPVKFPTTISPSLRELIDGMLQKNEARRFDWEQVKNSKFFSECPPVVVSPSIVEEPEKPKLQVKWDAEQQCAYMLKTDADFQQGKITVSELKYNQMFCLRITRLLGQVCVDRKKIPREIFHKVLKLITKLAMQKNQAKENKDSDLTKNKTLMTAIVSLALQENDQQLLQAQLELIGFLLKHNFDGVKIDTDHDSEITIITNNHLVKKQPGSLTVLCLKVLGILTSQAIWTLSQSQQYFQRAAEEKIVTQIAECYNVIPQSHIVLECLQKFIHPRIQRAGTISHKTLSIFKSLREEAASVLLKRKLITQVPLLSRKWNRSSQLEVYCQILFECLEVSNDMRNEFLKYTYWDELISKKNTKIYYLAYVYIILKHTGKGILSSEVVQNDIVQEQSQNKLINIFLIYAAYHKFKNHSTSKTKIDKVKFLLNNLKCMLSIDPAIKKKHCFQLLGSISQQCQFFDDVLIEVVTSLSKEYKTQEINNLVKSLAQETILHPLSEHSLVQLLQILQIRINSSDLPAAQSKFLEDYLLQNIKNQTFDDLLSVKPIQCSKLISFLIANQLNRLNDQRQIAVFAELIERHHFIRTLFSEQLIEEQFLLASLKCVNKIVVRLKSFDFLSHGALQSIKKYFSSSNEQLIIQIIIFCSNLARTRLQYARQVLQTKIMELCIRSFNEGSQLLKQKTLHLVGNLSKHNSEAFDHFQKYGIIGSICQCLAQYKSNKRILKNTIYSIGNISYYSDRFAPELKTVLKYLAEGLSAQDQNLLLNTLSTISNMLRHSSIYVATLTETGILTRVIQLYAKAPSAQQVNFYNNLLKKAVAFPTAFDEIQKQKLKSIIQTHLNKGLMRIQNQNVKKLQKLFS